MENTKLGQEGFNWQRNLRLLKKKTTTACIEICRIKERVKRKR